MKKNSTRILSRNWVLVLALLCPLLCSAAEYVKLTVQLEINDYLGTPRSHLNPDSRERIFTNATTVHCVIGPNTWFMEGDFARNATVTRWFTGTNIIETGVYTQAIPEAEVKRLAQNSQFAVSSPPAGQKFERIYPGDGNPGRRARVIDLMDLRGRICWLALCSGSALRREGRQLFPPSDLWKELYSAPAGFSDRTSVFADGFGLPRNIELLTPDQSRIFQYEVRQTTNLIGSQIPLEFSGKQYRPAGTNRWELQMTFKGTVTAISSCSELKSGAENSGPVAK